MNLKTWTQYAKTHKKLLGIALGSFLLIFLFVIFKPSSEEENTAAQSTAKVKEGPLTIAITQAGTIQAQDQDIITSQVQGQTTIIYLIEEGTRVKKGDLLVQLDNSNLQDQLLEQQIKVQNAEASNIQARETVAVTQNQNESDISLAELNYKFAQEDLTQYTEGEYKQTLMEAESKITLAEEQLQLADKKLDWSEKLYKEKYISQAERDADSLSYNRAKQDLELAKSSKKLLENFTYTRELAQRKSNVDQTGRALERVKLKANADIVQAQANFKAKESEWNQQKQKEAKIRDQITKTIINAPRDGLAVYATSAKASYRGNTEPLEAGQTVRERQELIYLPTADEMMAEVQVHESNLDKVHLGLPVMVTVDALQGKSFLGKVVKIAPLPDATSMWINPDLKVYRTQINIEGKHPELRTGMSCMASIVVAQYDKALYVPVQAVLRVDGQPSVYVDQGGQFKPTAVTVGLDNNRMIQVLSGLNAGQTVLLTPPLQAAATKDNNVPGQGSVTTDRLKQMIDQSNQNASQVKTNNTEAPPGASPPDKSKPEDQEAKRKRWESMTPEQREAMKKKSLERKGQTQKDPSL